MAVTDELIPFTENGRITGIRLANFGNDSDEPLASHKLWIEQAFIPAMKKHPGARIKMTGMASRNGDAGYNLGLSKRRIDKVANFILSKGTVNIVERNPRGEKEAEDDGFKDGNRSGRYRAVLIRWEGIAGPLPLPPTPPQPVPPEPNVLTSAFCKQNSKIVLDGTTAVQRTPPMPPAEWVAKTQAVFDTIFANRLGMQIVNAINVDVVIKPYLPNDLNSQTQGIRLISGKWTITFTADNFTGSESQPGCRPDEILLHELIHVLEQNFRGYEDPADKSLLFSGADFTTVNGTNVYSSSESRSLRKDHIGFVVLPSRYGTDAKEHMILFRENYEKAFDRNQTLFEIFKNHTGSWNPFAPFVRNVTNMQFRVEVSGDRNWKWHYDLFSDSTARWSDEGNIAEYGIGTWRKEGADFIVDWKGGGFDRFRDGGVANPVKGRNKTGGVERESKVMRMGGPST